MNPPPLPMTPRRADTSNARAGKHNVLKPKASTLKQTTLSGCKPEDPAMALTREDRDRYAIAAYGARHNDIMNKSYFQDMLANTPRANEKNEPDIDFRAILLIHAEKIEHSAKKNKLCAMGIADMSEKFIGALPLMSYLIQSFVFHYH